MNVCHTQFGEVISRLPYNLFSAQSFNPLFRPSNSFTQPVTVLTRSYRLGPCLLMRGFVLLSRYRSSVTVSCLIPAHHFHYACQLQPVLFSLSLSSSSSSSSLSHYQWINSLTLQHTLTQFVLLTWSCLSPVWMYKYLSPLLPNVTG